MAIYGDIRHILKPHGPKNRENLDFEITYGKFSERTGEHDRTIGKLIWRRKSVQNPFFLNLGFFRPCQITYDLKKKVAKNGLYLETIFFKKKTLAQLPSPRKKKAQSQIS